MRLAGLIIIRDEPGRIWRAAQREMRRVGIVRILNVLAFRLYARLRLHGRDEAWKEWEIGRLRRRYPASLDGVPRLVVTTPNAPEAQQFLATLAPDIAIARCKFILKKAIFGLPRVGTFVFHPGICPEYRNAHGCFWALANRDLDRVGMTLLKVDEGIDTGPVYLHASYALDEVRESHNVIQYRVVLENLDAIERILSALSRGEAVPPVSTAGRRSATWGQPRLTDYLRWKWTARRVHSWPVLRESPPAAPSSRLDDRAPRLVVTRTPSVRTVQQMQVVSLLFHDVYVDRPDESGFSSPAADRYKLSRSAFDAQLAGLARLEPGAPLAGDDLLSAPPGHQRRAGFTVTVDDGGVSYYTLIADTLEALGWRGHCFVTTGMIGRRGFLTEDQIRELDARGHVIGSHSASHPTRFSTSSIDDMRREWTHSRQALEDILGHRVTVASVPGGYFSRVVAKTAAEAGIELLFTSEPTSAIARESTCAVAGRFTIRRGAPPDLAGRLVATAPWARCAAWASWNAKAVIKPVLGASYIRLADWLLSQRPSTSR